MIFTIVRNWLYNAVKYTLRLGGTRLMPRPVSDDRIIVRFDINESIDLDELSDGFSALSRQYKKMLAEKGLSEKDAPARLLVTRLESGSLETEIAAWGATAWAAVQAADATLILADFTFRIRNTIGYFAGKNPRPEKLDENDVSDFETFIKPIAGRKNSKLSLRTATYRERTNDREIHASYEFDEQDLAHAFTNMAKETEDDGEPDRPDFDRSEKVALYWAQTNWIEAKTQGRTGDRGIIESIWPKPLPVYFTSENSIIKHKMTSGEFNPSKHAYIVDVSTESVRGQPIAYTVIDLYDTLPLENDDDGSGDLLG